MSEIKITVRDNGSLKLEGEGIVLLDAQGRSFGLGGRTVVGLCRCGQSANKPFCDGTHGKVGFQSVCEARELPPPAPKA